MTKRIRVLFAFTVVAGALTLSVRPALANVPTIKCEKCTCNLNTGICDCTNCTIVQS